MWPVARWAGILAKMPVACLVRPRQRNHLTMSLLNLSARFFVPFISSANGSRMRRFPLAGLLMAAAVAVLAAGCDAPGPAPGAGGSAEEHDNDDHAGHDHGHDDHDHAGHDHEGHDHGEAGHDHADDDHDHPETMADAVAMLKEMVAKVK